jgi:hypothetical protein
VPEKNSPSEKYLDPRIVPHNTMPGRLFDSVWFSRKGDITLRVAAPWEVWSEEVL